MNRLMYALILLGIGGLFPSVSFADDFEASDPLYVEIPTGEVLLGFGKMLNNTHTGPGEYVNVTARWSRVLGDLEGQISFTHVEDSSLGDHHGSAQFLEAGLTKVLRFRPFNLKDNVEVRGGLGSLISIHYAWGSHYDGEIGNEVIKAECNFCGWEAHASVSWKWIELGVVYTSTDPNLWLSYNGLRAEAKAKWRFGLDRDDGQAFLEKENRELPVAKTPTGVVQAPSVSPSATCSPPAQLEADNEAEPRHTMGPI